MRFSENASVDYEELDRRYFEELSAQPLPDFDAIDRRAAERAEEGKSSRGRKSNRPEPRKRPSKITVSYLTDKLCEEGLLYMGSEIN